MEANNKTIGNWLHDIQNGVIQLPRFQREESWKKGDIQKFFEAILKKHPLGVLLLLEVDSNNQPFVTRKILGAEKGTEKCRLHLLDGQQRLTALVRAMKDNYKNERYFIKFEKDEKGKFKEKSVIVKTRTDDINNISSGQEFTNGWIPVSLFEPVEEGSSRISKWKAEIITSKHWNDNQKEMDDLVNLIYKLRERISSTIMPFLLIPQGTDPNEAIEIFININTSSVKLRLFDIANAQCEQSVRKSLREYVNTVIKKRPKLAKLEGHKTIGDMILKIACMKQGMSPQMGNYKRLNYKLLHDLQGEILEGLEWTEKFVISEGLWDVRWLPSTVPFRVLPMIHPEFRKNNRTNEEKARVLIRCYLWRSFLTERYVRQANDRLHADFEELNNRLINKNFLIKNEKSGNIIFNVEKNKLPNTDDILEEGWPATKGVLKRAILAVCVKKGARGLENNRPLDEEHSPQRDYHHVYPKSILKKKHEDSLAVNCMMMVPDENQSWNNKWPGDYIATIAEKIEVAELTERLETHTVPAEVLIEAREGKIELLDSYTTFLKQRAELIRNAMLQLYRGQEYK